MVLLQGEPSDLRLSLCLELEPKLVQCSPHLQLFVLSETMFLEVLVGSSSQSLLLNLISWALWALPWTRCFCLHLANLYFGFVY